MKALRLFLLTLLMAYAGAMGMSAQEAYCAVNYGNTSDGHSAKTITFFYDTQRSSRNYTINVNELGNLSFTDDVSIIFDSSFANYHPTSTMYWFSSVTAKRKVSFSGWENLNTSEVTNMTGMFNGLGNYYEEDTGEEGKYIVENFDLSHFDISKVTDMTNMLNHITGVDKLDLSNFTFREGINTSKLLAYSEFKELTLPASAKYLADNACEYLTPEHGLCVLHQNMVLNSNCEGSDMTSLYSIGYGENSPHPADIFEGVGYNGSRCVKVHSSADAANDYDTMFYIYTPDHEWKEGDKYRFKMKVRADKASNFTTQSHTEPGYYVYWSMLDGDYVVSTEWQEIVSEGTITASQAGSNGIQTIAFVLNLKKEDNNFYFDDISWEPMSKSEVIWKRGCFNYPTLHEAYYVKSYEEKDDEGHLEIVNYTFYYDEFKDTRDMVYDVPKKGGTLNIDRADNLAILFDSSFANYRPTSTAYWFYNKGANNVTSFYGLENFNTSEVTNMSYMFCGFDGNIEIDQNGPDFSKLDVSNATNMNFMFADMNNHFFDPFDISSFNINANATTTGMFSQLKIPGISVSATANNLSSDAFSGVGTAEPVMLYCPPGFSPQGTTTGSGYINWKGGKFTRAYPYAVLSSDHKTLTFYCDDKSSSHNSSTGETVYSLNSLNTGVSIRSNYPGWYNAKIDNQYVREMIENVVFDEHFSYYHPKTCSYWFYGMNNLTNITHLDYLKTDLVVDFALMFYNCRKLTSIDVSHFDTSSAATFTSMFSSCRSLQSIDVSHFDDSHIPSGYGVNSMFAYCQSLENLDISNFVFSGTNNAGMLMYCSNLKSLTISASAARLPGDAFENAASASSPCRLTYPEDFKPEGAKRYETYMEWKGGYFKDSYEAYALLSDDGETLTFYCDKERDNHEEETFDLRITSNGTPTWYTSIENVKEVTFDASFAEVWPTDCSNWFSFMINLTTINNMAFFNTAKVTNMTKMFNGCRNLKFINLENFDTSGVTAENGFEYMFCGCNKLKSLDISRFTFNDGVSTNYMMWMCEALQILTIPANADNILNSNACLNVANSDKPCALVYPSGTTLTKENVHDNYYMWKNGYFTDTYPYAILSEDETTLSFYLDNQGNQRPGTLFTINLLGENLKWDRITTSAIESVVFNPSFAGARPESTIYWFGGMNNLQTIEGIEYLNTSEVTDMGLMFYNCSSLKSLDVSHFDTSKVKNMNLMFYFCQQLEELDISHFTLSDDVQTALMFFSCSSLKKLTIGEKGNNLANTACINVGSQANPCLLVYPDNFTPDKTEEGTGWYKWKSGYFKDAPYAVLSSDKKTLTFYYDNGRSSREGKAYGLNEGFNYPGWLNDTEFTKAVFDSSFANARPTSCFGWFEGKPNLEIVEGLQYLNTSESTSLDHMFDSCIKLESLDLSNFIIAKNITTAFLYDCRNLKRLTIPVTASNLVDGACYYVGTAENPCVLIYPENMVWDRENYEGYFIWKGGYFKDAGLAGDANEDGIVTVADVMLTVNKVLGKTLTTFNETNADVNSDGKITVSDVMGIVKIVLSN